MHCTNCTYLHFPFQTAFGNSRTHCKHPAPQQIRLLFIWAMEEAQMPGQVLHFTLQAGHVLPFQIKHRCILSSFASVLQITLLGEWKLFSFICYLSFKKKKEVWKTQKSAKKSKKGIFRIQEWQITPSDGFTHLHFYYSYSSKSSLNGLLIASLIILLNSNTHRLDFTISTGRHKSHTLQGKWISTVPLSIYQPPAALTHTCTAGGQQHLKQ